MYLKNVIFVDYYYAQILIYVIDYDRTIITGWMLSY